MKAKLVKMAQAAVRTSEVHYEGSSRGPARVLRAREGLTDRGQPPMRNHSNAESAAPPKRIFIVEDHPVLRKRLAELANREYELTVCGSAGSGAETLEVLERLKPDLALLDITTLPVKSGLELIKEVRAEDRAMKLLAVSMHDEAWYANRVLRLGADGYIMKEEGPLEIVSAMRDVLEGHIYVSEKVLAGARKAPAAAFQARAP